ncbi:MAG: hypothetical protein IJB92_06335, partial [Clostridia bacterium]|nr:hypothetical protein [Clostridia bacterium]
GSRGFWDAYFHASAYELPVKYGQRVIYFADGYSLGWLLIKICAQRILHVPKGHLTLLAAQAALNI